ncbi:MAG: phosphoglucosamine mutase [Acidobacteria bacterium RIFCSPLOWO2_02_FULL_68_18]|nr:MAG: phosphoglucosamine mutase [Acidobacteria bacterium RIFCSPLOWO2_02_FULL_68_18]OFW48395.1 MAG: phosphoglucosamine mutase [Acidobacteria bacterium RIFCSPLOWO2_12_FULL_68_19]
MRRLFGTDGVRGRAGEYPLDPPTVRRLGAALARTLGDRARGVRFLAGRDTRESGPWIERELAVGIRSQGGALVSAGVIPTPAIAYLTPRMDYTAGVVISASHNPFEDNGIKVFSGSGEKIVETLEDRVEAVMADQSWSVSDASESAGVDEVDCRAEYVDHLLRILPPDDRRARVPIALDCANGATATVAPQLFERLGFDIRRIGCDPNGRNINLGCGSTAPDLLARTVTETGCRLGIAYDGDGDRAIFVDDRGGIVDGDAVLLMCARQLKAEGRLKGNAVVATVMSNIGLDMALREADIEIVRCPVGDKYVMDELLRRGLSLGGEQSGHVIFSEHLFTGDGLATSLQVLRTMEVTGRALSDLAAGLKKYPQVLLNVRVDRKVDLKTIEPVAAVMEGVERRLAGHGRLLVRYSGTEPLLRIMLEGRQEGEIQRWAQEIADAVTEHLGRGM